MKLEASTILAISEHMFAVFVARFINFKVQHHLYILYLIHRFVQLEKLKVTISWQVTNLAPKTLGGGHL